MTAPPRPKTHSKHVQDLGCSAGEPLFSFRYTNISSSAKTNNLFDYYFHFCWFCHFYACKIVLERPPRYLSHRETSFGIDSGLRLAGPPFAN